MCLPLGTGASVVGRTMVSSDHFLPAGADPNVGEDASADTTGDTLGGLGWRQREGGCARPVSSGKQVVSTSYLQLYSGKRCVSVIDVSSCYLPPDIEDSPVSGGLVVQGRRKILGLKFSLTSTPFSHHMASYCPVG